MDIPPANVAPQTSPNKPVKKNYTAVVVVFAIIIVGVLIYLYFNTDYIRVKDRPDEDYGYSGRKWLQSKIDAFLSTTCDPL